MIKINAKKSGEMKYFFILVILILQKLKIIMFFCKKQTIYNIILLVINIGKNYRKLKEQNDEIIKIYEFTIFVVNSTL